MSPSDDDGDGFLSRWSRRKIALRTGGAEPAPASEVPAPPAMATSRPVAPAVPAGPTSSPTDQASTTGTGPDLPQKRDGEPPEPLPDIDSLTPDADFSRFVQRDVDPATRNAALKKLFADPRFNVIDEMDIDIMDYGKLEPLPPSMLRLMTQSKLLGLFRDEEEQASAPESAPPTAETTLPPHPAPSEIDATDEDPALRLQPVDAAGHPSDRPGPQEDAGRER
jgi:hypothetical protein